MRAPRARIGGDPLRERGRPGPARAKMPRDNLSHGEFCNDDLLYPLIFIESRRRMMRPLSWIECASGVRNGFNDVQAGT